MRDDSLLPAALQRPALTPIPRLPWSREEAAAAISLSVRELDDLIRTGAIKVIRCGRRVLVPPAMLQRWIDSQTAEAVEPQGCPTKNERPAVAGDASEIHHVSVEQEVMR